MALVALFQVLGILTRRAAAQSEYDALRDAYAPGTAQDAPAQGQPAQDAPLAPAIDHAGLAAINPDYVGWLDIPDTGISYLLAQGPNNDKYLYTTFEGQQNPAGAIFVDAGCAGDFTGQHTIIYGHNMKDGTMFGALEEYLDADFLAQHPGITITLPGGAVQSWRIFAARATDMHDAAYRMNFATTEDFAAFAATLGALQGAEQILTLSTCTSGGGDEERVLVHAVLEQ